jgi:hypothetical protein
MYICVYTYISFQWPYPFIVLFDNLTYKHLYEIFTITFVQAFPFFCGTGFELRVSPLMQALDYLIHTSSHV